MMKRDPIGRFAKNPEFKVGDIVRLKSGSPRLTVVRVIGTCLLLGWFDDQKSYHSNTEAIPAGTVEPEKKMNPADDPAFHWKSDPGKRRMS